MADTFGSLIDKLTTVGQKMFINQELLYEIRRMTFEEFRARYFEDPKGAETLWSTLKRACDLNVQRNNLITEIDEKLLEIVAAVRSGADVRDATFIQPQHKTY